MTPKSPLGTVYLAASSRERTLRVIAAQILASIERRPLRVAATYAAAGAAMVDQVTHSIARLFDGAAVTRFTVEGESASGGRTMGPDEAIAIVEDADLVFVSGGDPIQGVRRLARVGADAWLRDARGRGTACLGISAGAIMLAAWWAEWPDDPPAGAPHDGGELVRGAGVVSDLVVDCHAEDDDWNELYLVRAMLRDRPDSPRLPRFLGLPTGTGVVIGPDGSTVEIGGRAVSLRAEDARPSP